MTMNRLIKIIFGEFPEDDKVNGIPCKEIYRSGMTLVKFLDIETDYRNMHWMVKRMLITMIEKKLLNKDDLKYIVGFPWEIKEIVYE
jgi:hypothetical protein